MAAAANRFDGLRAGRRHRFQRSWRIRRPADLGWRGLGTRSRRASAKSSVAPAMSCRRSRHNGISIHTGAIRRRSMDRPMCVARRNQSSVCSILFRATRPLTPTLTTIRIIAMSGLTAEMTPERRAWRRGITGGGAQAVLHNSPTKSSKRRVKSRLRCSARRTRGPKHKAGWSVRKCHLCLDHSQTWPHGSKTKELART